MAANQQAGSHAFTRLLLGAVAVLKVPGRHDVAVLTADAALNRIAT